MPHLLLGEDEDVVVGAAGRAAIRRARHAGAELVPRARHGLAEALVIAQAHPDQVDHRVLHRDLDLLAESGQVTLHERGENADHAVHPGARVADGRPHVRGRPIGRARDAHGAAHRLGDGLVALVVAVGAVRPEALDARVDEAGVERPHRGIAEAQAIEDARPEVLEEDVGALEELAEHLLASRVLQVQGQAALVGIEREVEEAVGVRAIPERVTRDIPAAGLLDLDDVRPEPGQHLAARRPGLIVREIDDANARQRAAHRLRPPAAPPPRPRTGGAW